MTSTQWRALYDYCRLFGYTRRELLDELKANGSVDPDTTFDNLADYVKGPSYDAMMNFLEANL